MPFSIKKLPAPLPILGGTPLEIAEEILRVQRGQMFRQSVDGAGSCVMKNEKGDVCAFGGLLPPDMVKQALANVTSGGAVVNGECIGNSCTPRQVFECTYKQQAVIQYFQAIHDCTKHDREMESVRAELMTAARNLIDSLTK